MSDVRRVVETEFTAVDHASSVMGAVQQAGSRLSNILSPLTNPIALALGGFAGGAAIQQFIQLQSHAEGTELAITGAMRAYDAAGASQASINARFQAGSQEWINATHDAFVEARGLAHSVIEQIEHDAAALPGTAQDYVEVYRTALPAALSAGMSDARAFATMSNQFAAVAAANQVSSIQAASDLNRMLMGHAGMDTPMFRHLQVLIGKTTEQFNRLRPEQRIQAVQHALDAYRPLLNEFNSTWDAIWGTTTAFFNIAGRKITMPIFNYIKDMFGAMNTELDAMMPRITALGIHLSTALVDSIDAVREFVTEPEELRGIMGDALTRFHGSNTFSSLSAGADTALSAGRTIAGIPGVEELVVGMLTRSLLGPIGLLAGPLSVFAQDTAAVDATFSSLIDSGVALIDIVQPVVHVMSVLNTIAGEMIAAVLPSLSSALEMIVQEIAPFIAQVFVLTAHIAEQLQPTLVGLARDVGSLIVAVAEFLQPILMLTGSALLRFYNVTSEYIVPALTSFVDMLRWTIRSLAEILHSVGVSVRSDLLGSGVGVIAGSGAPTGEASDIVNRLRSSIERLTTAQEEQTQATTQASQAQRRTPPQRRAGHQTVFNNNRFDIMQRFAEGFDPGRVVAAMAREVNDLADHRVQSSLDPLFSLQS